MYNIISSAVKKMSLNDIFNFAVKNDINLSNEEAKFILEFIKDNWYILLKNQDISFLNQYQSNFSDKNFTKIKNLLIYYKERYGKFFN